MFSQVVNLMRGRSLVLVTIFILASLFLLFLTGKTILEKYARNNLEIHGIASKGTEAELKSLIEENPNVVNRKDKVMGFTPLHMAAFSNNVNNVKVLIEAGADLNARNHFGETPLHRAVAGNSLRTAQLLIDRGADIEARKHNGLTPLMKAVANKKVEIAMIKLLIESGAKINAVDNSNRTVLDWTKLRDRKEVIQLLKNG